MNNSILVSVVIPVYNVEHYLTKCVCSVLSQTYQRLDIILVDDGSTDLSGRICDEFASKDNRVRAFHKANGGLSDARNYGLRCANGDWISFVDSDDYISPVFIEALLTAALDSDSAIAAIPGGCPFHEQSEVNLVADLKQLDAPQIRKSVDVLQQMLYQRLGTETPYHLFKLRGQNSIRILCDNPFPVGYFYEDLGTTYKFIHAAGSSIAIVDSNYLYAYRIRPDSIIRQSYSPLKADSSIAISQRLCIEISEWYPELKTAVASRCFSVNRMVYAQVSPDQINERARLWTELKRYRWTVLTDPRARLRERIAALIACFGQQPFYVFCQICRKIGLMR